MNLIKNIASFIGIDMNTFITILITLFVFSLGLITNWIAGKLKEKRQNNNLRNCFFAITESFIESIIKQGAEFKKSSIRFKEKHSGDFSLAKVAISHIDNVDKIPFLELFNALVNARFFNRRKHVEEFNNLFKSYGTIKNIEVMFEANISDFKVRHATLEVEWNDNLNSIRKLFDELAIESKLNPLQDINTDFLRSFDDVMYNWQQQDKNFDKFVVHEELLLPLREVTKKYNNLKVFLPLTNYILAAMNVFDNHVKMMAIYAELFDDYETKYTRSAENMKTAISILK